MLKHTASGETATILAEVKKNPDLTISQIAKKMGKSKVELCHYVRILEQLGLVYTLEIGASKVVRLAK